MVNLKIMELIVSIINTMHCGNEAGACPCIGALFWN
jgi:hypothetical protein